MATLAAGNRAIALQALRMAMRRTATISEAKNNAVSLLRLAVELNKMSMANIDFLCRICAKTDAEKALACANVQRYSAIIIAVCSSLLLIRTSHPQADFADILEGIVGKLAKIGLEFEILATIPSRLGDNSRRVALRRKVDAFGTEAGAFGKQAG